MNADLKESFARIKPVCDLVMVCPSAETIAAFMEKIGEMKVEAIQELQQYILFPFITHIKSEEMDKKYELQSKMADAMRSVLERVTVNSFEMCMKIEAALLSLIFDNSKPGMVAEGPEELKLSVMRCLTTLMLRLDNQARGILLKTQVPTIAQAVFVAVHVAKLEKLRILRLAAIDCLTAHTCTHPKLTDDKCQITDKHLELAVVDTLSNILPGVLAALQDVATDVNNPGHAVVVAALEAMHRVLCLTMHDKHMPRRPDLTAQDFADMVKEKTAPDKDVSKEKKQKFLPKRSLEWYSMAGEKISVVTRSVASLATHEHPAVRRELAVLCYRILTECNATMQPSAAIALDILISLSKDEFPEVSAYCASAVAMYMTSQHYHKTTDGLCENFFAILNSLPRILNNIDSARKLAALNLLHGYILILCDSSRPQRLTSALSAHHDLQSCCHALLQAVAFEPVTSLAQHADRDVTSPPPTNSPWCKLRHLDTEACEQRLREILQLIGSAECAELVADRLLELFHQQRDSEIVYTINWMAAATNSPLNLVRRVLNTYTEEDVWYSPIEVVSPESPVTNDETRDVSVYNPRAWIKDSVPDLYEGATETRYTDITYLTPRSPAHRDPNSCATLAEAQRNMLLSCLLTEGVGVMARRLGEEYQPFLLKTLCLVLERVGSKYEMLHLAGLKAINDISLACGHSTVADLIRDNADYFTHQVTVRLKKAWNSQSALQILSVVMEYSDATILDCLYGIVEDVLVQSLDKYYEKNLDLYLQVFLTFIQCIKKWFPEQTESREEKKDDVNIFQDVIDFVNNREVAERLMDCDEMERESGKSAEEMYREDMERREEDILDYDDKVTEEKPPISQHIRVTVTILKRCINFITSTRRDECILSLQVLTSGFPILKEHEDELLPLVHQAWAPLVARFEGQDPVVLRRAFDLLVTMAELSKDFIRTRAVKEVFPHIFKFLHKSSLESYLKDTGSAYRNSQAYSLQISALTALPTLAVDLMLEDERLIETMACANLYLSKKQPKPLQALAVRFFKVLLDYDYHATWQYLRKICDNDIVMHPPEIDFKLPEVDLEDPSLELQDTLDTEDTIFDLKKDFELNDTKFELPEFEMPSTEFQLEPVVGTPYEATNKDIDHNIKLIWDLVQ